MLDAPSGIWKCTEIIQNIRFALQRGKISDAPCIMLSLSLASHIASIFSVL